MGAKAGALQSAELGNFGAQLVHNNLQMRSMGATESALNHSKQKKRGEYEQGRKNWKTAIHRYFARRKR